MKLAKIFTAIGLSALMFSSNTFAKNSANDLKVGYNRVTGELIVRNITTWKSNGTAEGDALAKKCNALEKKRVDKYVEEKKYSIEHIGLSHKPDQLAHAKKLIQEKNDMSKNMVKEGCFKK